MRTGRFRWLTAGLLLIHAALLAQIMHRGMGQFFDVEEGFIAFTAHALRNGPEHPWTVYVHTEYQNGTVLLGALTVPFFAVLGETVLALKLVSIFLSLLTLLLVVVLGARIFGRGTALVAGLLLAVGPPPWLTRGIQTMGDTSEATLFVVAQWIVVAVLDASDGAWSRRRWAVALGLVTGLGLTFNLSLVASTAAVVVYWLWTRGREEWPLLLLGLVGCLAGLALPLYNLLVHDVRFYLWQGKGLHRILDGPAGWVRALADIFSIETRNGFYLELDVGRLGRPELIWVHRIYWGAALAAWLWCGVMARRARRSGEGKLFTLFGVILLSYLLNNRRNHYLLLMLVPVAALAIARVFTWIAGESRWRAIRWPLTGVLVATFCVGQLLPLGALFIDPATRPIYDMRVVNRDRWIWRVKTFGRDLVVPLEDRVDVPAIADRDAFGSGQWLSHRGYAGDTACWLALGQRSPTAAALILHGYGYNAAGHDPDEESIRKVAALGPPSLSYVALAGFGQSLAEGHWIDLESRVPQLGAGLPWAARRMLYLGLGYGFGIRFCHNPHRFRSIAKAVPAPWWPAFLQGLQDRVYHEIPAGPRHAELLVEFFQLPGRPGGVPLAVGPVEVDRGVCRIARPGAYMLWIQVESAGPAGVWAQVDEQTVIPLTQIAPTRGARWLRLGRVPLAAGRRQVRVWTTHGEPSVRRIRFTYY